MDTPNISTSSIIQEKKELEAICAELNLTDIKYLPSPKGNGNISELTKHATAMLSIYKRYKNGDQNAPIKQIFTED